MTGENEYSNNIIERYTSGVSVNTSNQENSDEETPITEISNEKDASDNVEETDISEQSDGRTNEHSKDSEDVVKDRKSVLMYLPDDIKKELDIRFDELNAKHKRQHGEAIEKNRDYYPAVILSGLTNNDLIDILEL